MTQTNEPSGQAGQAGQASAGVIHFAPGPCTCVATGVTLNRPVENATIDCEIAFCPLHAAAPEMFKALQNVVALEMSDARQLPVVAEIIRIARAVLAKAGGK